MLNNGSLLWSYLLALFWSWGSYVGFLKKAAMKASDYFSSSSLLPAVPSYWSHFAVTIWKNMLIRQKYNSFATSPIFPSWQPYLLATGNDPTPSLLPSLNLALGEMWYLFGGKTLASARLLLSTATASAKRRRTVVMYSRHSFSMPAIWPGLEIAFTPLNRSLLSCYDTYSFFLSRNQFGAFTVRLSHYRCKPIAVLLNVFFLSFHSHFLFPPQSSSEHVGGRRADIVLKRPGADGQCQSPRVWPDFVHVQTLFIICPAYD